MHIRPIFTIGTLTAVRYCLANGVERGRIIPNILSARWGTTPYRVVVRDWLDQQFPGCWLDAGVHTIGWPGPRTLPPLTFTSGIAWRLWCTKWSFWTPGIWDNKSSMPVPPYRQQSYVLFITTGNIARSFASPVTVNILKTSCEGTSLSCKECHAPMYRNLWPTLHFNTS